MKEDKIKSMIPLICMIPFIEHSGKDKTMVSGITSGAGSEDSFLQKGIKELFDQ